MIVEGSPFEQRAGAVTLTVGAVFTTKVFEPVPEQFPMVTVTLYKPATVAEKLDTLPGFVTPAGTVHT